MVPLGALLKYYLYHCLGDPDFSKFVDTFIDDEVSECEVCSDDENDQSFTPSPTSNVNIADNSESSESDTDEEFSRDDAEQFAASTSQRRTFWKRVNSDLFQPLPPAAPPVIEVRGTEISPYDYFSKYIPVNIIIDLTMYTNMRYMKDKGKVFGVTEAEMRKFGNHNYDVIFEISENPYVLDGENKGPKYCRQNAKRSLF